MRIGKNPFVSLLYKILIQGIFFELALPIFVLEDRSSKCNDFVSQVYDDYGRIGANGADNDLQASQLVSLDLSFSNTVTISYFFFDSRDNVEELPIS